MAERTEQLFVGAGGLPPGSPMDWTALVGGPLPNVFLRHVSALVVQADEPSDADVLTVEGEAPMDTDNGDVDVDLASSSCSSASSMSCPAENFPAAIRASALP